MTNRTETQLRKIAEQHPDDSTANAAMKESKRYSVSITYSRNVNKDLEIELRASVLVSRSKEEALGVMINHLKEEMKGFNILCHVVIEVETEEAENLKSRQ